MEHGKEFARLMHPDFDRLVSHYTRKWTLSHGLVEQTQHGWQWNQPVIEQHFYSVDGVEAWMRTSLGKTCLVTDSPGTHAQHKNRWVPRYSFSGSSLIRSHPLCSSTNRLSCPLLSQASLSHGPDSRPALTPSPGQVQLGTGPAAAQLGRLTARKESNLVDHTARSLTTPCLSANAPVITPQSQQPQQPQPQPQQPPPVPPRPAFLSSSVGSQRAVRNPMANAPSTPQPAPRLAPGLASSLHNTNNSQVSEAWPRLTSCRGLDVWPLKEPAPPREHGDDKGNSMVYGGDSDQEVSKGEGVPSLDPDSGSGSSSTVVTGASFAYSQDHRDAASRALSSCSSVAETNARACNSAYINGSSTIVTEQSSAASHTWKTGYLAELLEKGKQADNKSLDAYVEQINLKRDLSLLVFSNTI